MTVPMALEAVEEVLRELALGEAVNIPRERTRIRKGALHILQGAVESQGGDRVQGQYVHQRRQPFSALSLRQHRGSLEAIIEADYLGMMRTAAAGGIAAGWLSRPDAAVAGLFGTGWQAQGQGEAPCRVRPITRIKVLGRYRERLRIFCARNSELLGIPVEPAASSEEVVRSSDIVITATTSSHPVVHHPWVEEGIHLTAIGSNALIRSEIDEKTLLRCDLVTVDARDVGARECGDLLPLLEKGRINWRQIHELGEIIAGRVPGRGHDRDITLFES